MRMRMMRRRMERAGKRRGIGEEEEEKEK